MGAMRRFTTLAWGTKKKHRFVLTTMKILFKTSVPTALKTCCDSNTKTNQLMQFRQITAVYSENNCKVINLNTLYQYSV
jgi:hypothetical protein